MLSFPLDKIKLAKISLSPIKLPATFDNVVNRKIKNKLRKIKDHSKNFHQQWFGAVENFSYKNHTPIKIDYLKFTIEHNTVEHAMENYPTVPGELIRHSFHPDMTIFWTHSALVLNKSGYRVMLVFAHKHNYSQAQN